MNAFDNPWQNNLGSAWQKSLGQFNPSALSNWGTTSGLGGAGSPQTGGQQNWNANVGQPTFGGFGGGLGSLGGLDPYGISGYGMARYGNPYGGGGLDPFGMGGMFGPPNPGVVTPYSIYGGGYGNPYGGGYGNPYGGYDPLRMYRLPDGSLDGSQFWGGPFGSPSSGPGGGGTFGPFPPGGASGGAGTNQPPPAGSTGINAGSQQNIAGYTPTNYQTTANPATDPSLAAYQAWGQSSAPTLLPLVTAQMLYGPAPAGAKGFNTNTGQWE